MSLEEIAALTLDSEINRVPVRDTLKNRLFNEAIKLLQDGEELLFEDFAPSEADMESELLFYKSELTEAETERLRIMDLHNRINALHELPYAHATLRSDVPNAALWVKQNILENSDHAQAEFFMAELEVKDAELKAEVDNIKIAQDLIKQKREELKAKPSNQVTLPDLVEVVKSLI